MKPVLAAVAFTLSLVTAAYAGAPEPVKPVDLSRFMGRWYELLRTPNANEKNCFAPYEDWSRNAGGDIQVLIVCHRGAVDGPLKIIKTSTRVLNPPQNTKFESKMFGLLTVGRYWVVDHAPDYGWMIATTENGRFPALLTRKSHLAANEVAAMRSRMAALGFDKTKLEGSSPAAPHASGSAGRT